MKETFEIGDEVKVISGRGHSFQGATGTIGEIYPGKSVEGTLYAVLLESGTWRPFYDWELESADGEIDTESD